MAELLVARGEVPWNYRDQDGISHVIPVAIYNNHDIVAEKRDLIPGEVPMAFLTGYGAGETIAETVEKLGAEHQVYAVGIRSPFDAAPPTYHAVEAVGAEVLHTAMDYIREEVVGVPIDTPAQVMGLSEGGLLAGAALKARHEGVGDVVYLATPVSTARHISRWPEALLRTEFLLRFGMEGMKQEHPLGREAWENTNRTLRQLRFDLRTDRYEPKVGTAVTLDVVGPAVAHAMFGDQAFISGNRDGVSRPHIIKRALNEVPGRRPDNPVVIVLPKVAHPSPVNSYGIRLIDAGVNFLRQAQGGPQAASNGSI